MEGRKGKKRPTTFDESEYTYLQILFIQSMFRIGIGNT